MIIFFQDNGLTDIPNDLATFQSLLTLLLDGNPFFCGCDLMWLRDLLLEDKFKNSSTFVYCGSPNQLKDKKLQTLSTTDLNCYLLQGPMKMTILAVSIAVTIIILIFIFFLSYRYHENIKNTCKRGFQRPSSRRKRRSVISSGKELDTATKTSFLSQSSYPFSENEDFQVRASLMSASPGPGANGGYPVTMNSLNYPYNTNSFNSRSLHHPVHHCMPNNYASPNYSNEYDAPINSINFPHLHNHSQQQIDHNLPIHYALHHQHQPVKVPITEL